MFRDREKQKKTVREMGTGWSYWKVTDRGQPRGPSQTQSEQVHSCLLALQPGASDNHSHPGRSWNASPGSSGRSAICGK